MNGSAINIDIDSGKNFHLMSAIGSEKSFKNGTGCPQMKKNKSVSGFEGHKGRLNTKGMAAIRWVLSIIEHSLK